LPLNAFGENILLLGKRFRFSPTHHSPESHPAKAKLFSLLNSNICAEKRSKSFPSFRSEKYDPFHMQTLNEEEKFPTKTEVQIEAKTI
jgi:hypothetical protein